MTLAEFRSNTSETIWNELLVLGMQPGVCNLGQGFPDYSGSRVAREAAAAAMVDPSMVSFAVLLARPAEHSPISHTVRTITINVVPSCASRWYS